MECNSLPQSGDLFHWGVKMGYPYKNLWRKPPIKRLLQNFLNRRHLADETTAKIWNN